MTVYIERHSRNEVNKLYHDVLTQKCKLEQQVFKNTLILATQAPDEFSYHVMKGLGNMSTIAVVSHTIECIPIEIKYHKQKNVIYTYQSIKKIRLLFLRQKLTS